MTAVQLRSSGAVAYALGFSLSFGAGCAGQQHVPTTEVIVAGSVCSGAPRLVFGPAPTAASSSATPPAALVTATAARQTPTQSARPALLAYATASGPAELVVYDLAAAKERFRVSVALRNRPQLLEDVVVSVDAASQLVGYDVRPGSQGTLRFRTPAKRASWLGAVQVGPLVISTSTSLSFRPDERGSTITAIDVRDGSVRWQREVSYALSRPVARDEQVLVLSDHADVWALNANDGSTTGCAPVQGEAADWLEVQRGQLLIGASDARIAESGPSQSEGAAASRLQPPFELLPGRPTVHPSSYASVPAGRSAYGRVGVDARLIVTPVNSGAPAGLELLGSRFSYVFYRDLFSYRADGQLQWARLFDGDVVLTQAVGDELLVLTDNGGLYRLGSVDGSVRAELHLRDRIASANAMVDQPLDAAVGTSPSPVDTAPSPSLREHLTRIALDTDARMLPGRKLSVSELAKLSDPVASEDLLRVYTQKNAPSELRAHVAAVLATRRLGVDYLLAALSPGYDFLVGQPAPPLAAIVPGLIHNAEKRAVPGLVERLFDPDTSLAEMQLVVAGLVELGAGNPVAVQALARFVAMYHADSSFRSDASALVTAARALWKPAGATDVADTAETKLVASISHDPATVPDLLAALVPLMAAPEHQPEVETEVAPVAEVPSVPLGRRRSDADIARSLGEHTTELRACVDALKDPALRTVRFAMVIEPDGTTSQLHVWPERPALTQCVTPIVRTTRFSGVTSGRSMASYSFVVRPATETDVVASARSEEAPFWRRAELRATAMRDARDAESRSPWWRDQNPLFVAVDEPIKPAAEHTPERAHDAATGTQRTSRSTPPAAAPSQPSASQPQPAAAPGAEPTDTWWLPAHAP